jgi:hypothetical protein
MITFCRYFAKSIPNLTSVGITHVLNCAEGRGVGIDRFVSVMTGPEFYGSTSIVYKGIKAIDSITYDLSKHFEDCVEFIADALIKHDGK